MRLRNILKLLVILAAISSIDCNAQPEHTWLFALGLRGPQLPIVFYSLLPAHISLLHQTPDSPEHQHAAL